MIDRDHRLPVKRQAELLGISRGTVYYQPAPTRGPFDFGAESDGSNFQYWRGGAPVSR